MLITIYSIHVHNQDSSGLSQYAVSRPDSSSYYLIVNPRRYEEKKVIRRHEGGGGVSIGPTPSIFKSIQLIDMKLAMCNKCQICFQLSIFTWHLIGFHGNYSNIMTSPAAAILDFQIFNIFSYSKLNT